MIDTLMADEAGPGLVFSQWHSPGTPFYNRDTLCIMGDAAHATLPWMGQGACLSLEDAAVLSASLGKLDSARHLPAAFQAFTNARRDRAEHVIRQSERAAKLLTGQLSMDPADTAQLHARKWWTDVWAIDIDDHVRGAVEDCERMRR